MSEGRFAEISSDLPKYRQEGIDRGRLSTLLPWELHPASVRKPFYKDDLTQQEGGIFQAAGDLLLKNGNQALTQDHISRPAEPEMRV